MTEGMILSQISLVRINSDEDGMAGLERVLRLVDLCWLSEMTLR